jgi:hypothetical protein
MKEIIDKKKDVLKFIWTKYDTFNTIHKRLLLLEGGFVLSTDKNEKEFKIFSVGDIKETHIVGLVGFNQLSDTTICSIEKRIDMWGFEVDYGVEDDKGNRISKIYRFTIPRNSTYEEDVELNRIMFDENHPFIFYQLKEL